MEELKPKGGTPEYRAWYYINKYQVKGKQSKKEKEARNKEFITELKKNSTCNKCNEDRFYILEFHHLDPNLKYKSVTDLQFNAYSIKTIQKEIDKCVVLCRNCHAEFHYLKRQKIIQDINEYINYGL